MKMLKNTAAALALVLLAACSGENTSGEPETDTTATTGQSIQQTGTATATTTGATGGTMSAMTPEDKEFVSKAGMGGLFEVQAGQLALSKGASADVRAFAQRMVTDHGKANAELAQLAVTKGLALPTELGGTHESAFEHLDGLSGAEFDKAYMQHMVEDHNKDVAEFERVATVAGDADLKGWAGKTLPTLQQHQAQAKEISSKLR
jgi:putative membrane protein